MKSDMKNRIVLIIIGVALLFATSLNVFGVSSKDDPKKKKSYTVTLTASNYKAETSEGLVLVDFWAAWCGPCRKIAPMLEEVAKDYKDLVKIGKVNVDNYKKFSIDLGVEVLPTIVVYKDGKEMTRLKGVVSKDKIVEIIEAYSAKDN